MPSVDELFDQMEEQGVEAYAEEQYCVIDADTRTITVPPEYQLLGVENDKKVERLYFRCPKIVGDNIDLSTGFQLFICFENAGNEADAYHIDDMQVEADNIIFSWLLGEAVTRYKGNVQFAFCAIKPGEEGEPDLNRWNTTINNECVCLIGLKSTEIVEEQNADAIAQLWDAISQISTGGSGGTNNYDDLQNKPKINNVELTGNKTADDLGLQPNGEYLTSDDLPEKLPNPYKLKFTGAVTDEYDGSQELTVDVPQGGTTMQREEKQSTDTIVTLQPNVLYVFPEMASLTVTLAEPDNPNVANEYHFFFISGATATTLTLNDVLSDAYSIEANMKYEVSILENVAYIKGVSVSAA